MLNYFRKNTKIILAFLGVLLMVSWLIVPAIQGIWETQGTVGADPVAVTWKGGRLTQRELRYQKIVHSSTVQFINLIMQETVARQGTPRAPGHPQPGYLGIQGEATDQGILQTLILAQRAKELGVKISDETVKNYLLDNIGDRTLKEGDLAGLVKQAIPDVRSGVTQGAIFEHLKSILLAQQLQLMFQAGVETMTPGDISPPSGMPAGLLPPSEMWKVYEKLNRKVTIEAYPVRVADFVAKVTAKPTEDELQELFEKGRRRTPNPFEKDPAFRQPYRVAFEYVNLELAPFLEAAKKEITEEQIVTEYEKGKAAGNFKADPPAIQPEVKPGDAPADKPADDKKPTEGDKPADDKPADDKPAENPKPTEEKPAEKPADPKPTEKPAETKPAEPNKNDGSSLQRDVQLVSFQEDEKKKSNEPPAETKPADPVAKPDTKPDDPAAAEAKPAETNPGEPATTEPMPVMFKTLDEVRDEIRTTLARPIATERRNAVLAKILQAVNEYGRNFNRWKASTERLKDVKTKPGKGEKPREKPAPLNLPEVAGDASLKVQMVPLIDAFDIDAQVDDPQPDGAVKKKPKYPIASTIRFDLASRQFPRFSEFAFQRNMGLYYADTLPFPRDSDSRFLGGGGENLWVYWRTAEEPAKELDFAAARKDVETYWQRKEAFKLAEEAALKLAEQAGKGKELKTLVPSSQAVISPPPFTWYTSGSIGGQFAQPMPSQVEGIQYTGENFFQSVFDLQVGQAGVAIDEPQTTLWVVRLVSEEGDLNRDRFLEKAHDRELVIVAYQTHSALQQNMYEELIERYDIIWAPEDVNQEE